MKHGLDALVVLPVRGDKRGAAKRAVARWERARAFNEKQRRLAAQAIAEYESERTVERKLAEAYQARRAWEQYEGGRLYHVEPWVTSATEVVKEAHTGWGIDRRRVAPHRAAYCSGGTDACWLIGVAARRPWWRYSTGTAWEMGPDAIDQIDTSNIGRNADKHVKAKGALVRKDGWPFNRKHQAANRRLQETAA